MSTRVGAARLMQARALVLKAGAVEEVAKTAACLAPEATAEGKRESVMAGAWKLHWAGVCALSVYRTLSSSRTTLRTPRTTRATRVSHTTLLTLMA